MGRNEETRKLLDNKGAKWRQLDEEGDETEVVDHFGDPESEYKGLVETGLGIIERGQRDTLVIHGPEAVPWLQGLVTNDLHELVDEGTGQRNAVVNKTGQFISDLRILHIPRLLVVDLEAETLDDGLWSHLRGQIILEDVELQNRTDQTGRLGIYGERAVAVLEAFADWKETLTERAPFEGTWARWQGTDLVAQRMVWSEMPGFELICDVEVMPRLIDELEESLDEFQWFGEETFDTFRVESGVPRLGVELDGSVIPLEAGFDDAISFEKGCYLGQEIIARLDTRGTPAKMLRRVVFNEGDRDDVPETGTSIYPADGGERSVGDVKSAVWSPRLGAPVALAFIKRKHNDIGNTVVVDEAEARLEPILDFADYENTTVK